MYWLHNSLKAYADTVKGLFIVNPNAVNSSSIGWKQKPKKEHTHGGSINVETPWFRHVYDIYSFITKRNVNIKLQRMCQSIKWYEISCKLKRLKLSLFLNRAVI